MTAVSSKPPSRRNLRYVMVTVEISGAEPRYEPLNPTANRDYQRDGKSYKIVQGRPALAELARPLFMMRNPAVI